MRRRNLLIRTALVLGLGLTLAGCESFEMPDMFVSKKKLPGDRKLVFPEGVPGVTQGVPPELVRGNQPPQDAQAAMPGPPPAQQRAQEQPAEKPKPAPRPRVASPKPAQPAPAAQPQAQQQPSAAPWPAATPQASQQSPWPSTTGTQR
jgi:hypothetical protein